MLRRIWTCLVVAAVFAAAVSCVEGRAQHFASNGILDLTGWNLERDGSVNLDGKWEIYWGKLLTPQDFRSGSFPATQYWETPSVWDEYTAAGKRVGEQGFATFRLRIVNINPASIQAAIRITEVWSAYRLWVNGTLVAESGKVGVTEESEIPQPLMNISDFRIDGGNIDLVLQVSNHHYRDGGISASIRFGPENMVRMEQVMHWGVILLFMGGLLGMGFYQIVIYSFRRKEKSSLYLGIYSFVWFTHILTSSGSGWVVRLATPAAPWETLCRIALVTYFISSPIMLLFFRTLYRQEFPAFVTRFYAILSVTFSLLTLLVPIRIATSLQPIYHLLSLFGIGLVVFLLVKAVGRQREGAATILAGFGFLAISGINDILYNMRYIQTGYTIQFGVLSLIFAQSFAISRRFSTAFCSVEKLSTELEQKNITLSHIDRLKDEFLTNTSHELRTPLSGIVGLSEGMLAGAAGEIPPKAAENLSMITASARRLAALVNDILDFSRLKNRDIVLNRLPIDIRSITEMVLELSRQLSHGKPLVISNAIPFGLPAVDADEDRLQQILFNLIGNAIKFTNRGEITVSAAVTGEMMEVSVTDTGIGIPADKLDDIFLSFEQVDSSATRRYGGTGLGLPITRDLIELHGGKVSVASEPGRGSTFRFTVPTTTLAAVATETPRFHRMIPLPLEATMDANPSLPHLPTEGRPMVLVVDDEPINLQVAILQLVPAGITVATATSGLEALAMIEGGNVPDLVLLDLMMPKMTGFEVCRRLRDKYPPSKLPIIIVTARNRVSDLVEGFSAGAVDYLTKPFSRDELLARVRTHLKLRESFMTLEENFHLKKELERRKVTEQELRCIQRRLSELLHVVPDALLAVNEYEEITFCNRAFETLVGGSDSLLGLNVRTVLSAEAIEAIKPLLEGLEGAAAGKSVTITASIAQIGGATVPVSTMAVPVELEEEIIVIITLRLGASFGLEDSALLSIVEEVDRSKRTIAALENTLTCNGMQLKPEAMQEVRDIEAALERVIPETGSSADEKRRLSAVKIMQLALDCWESSTGKTKVDLAIESRLWKVYTNLDGWDRTQTLDRYLDVCTLPSNPRWRKIVATGDFVLASVGSDSQLRHQLDAALTSLTLHENTPSDPVAPSVK